MRVWFIGQSRLEWVNKIRLAKSQGQERGYSQAIEDPLHHREVVDEGIEVADQ
jgi:hypothetical protein